MNVLKRSVEANTLRSERKPEIEIRIHDDLTYAGGTIFDQLGDSEVEQHLFIDAEEDGVITRLLWVQFASFVEPTLEPETGLSWDEDDEDDDYEEDEYLQLADLVFLHEAGLFNLDEDYVMRPDSRSAQAIRFLDGQGYRLSGDAMFDRLMWLDRDRRSELSILYSESLEPLSMEAEDLEESGEAAQHWPALAEGLHERAIASFTLTEPD